MTIKEAKNILKDIRAEMENARDKIAVDALNVAIQYMEERPHGEWIKKTDGLPNVVTIEWFECSACGVQKSEGTPFCPWCGASMKKEGEAE